MNKSVLYFAALLGSTVCSLHAKNSESVSASYTFSKLFISDYSQDYIRVDSDGIIADYPTSFSWGKQGAISYTKALANSSYSFVAQLEGVHNSFKFAYSVPIDSGEILNYNGPTVQAVNQDAFFYTSTVFNLMKLDLLMESSILKTKHNMFYIQGGLISSWYQIIHKEKYVTDVSNYNQYQLLQHLIETNKDKIKNVFLGPNFKIGLSSNFYKNRLAFNLKAGLGFMMDFFTLKTRNVSDGVFYDPNYAPEYSDNRSITSNTYRLCPQAEIEASLTYTYHDLSITGGLNQFWFGYDLNYPNILSLNFGGPFIKAAYSF
jgi:hypothetical protein